MVKVSCDASVALLIQNFDLNYESFFDNLLIAIYLESTCALTEGRGNFF